ncbi:hypothetical protein B0H94_102179 [Salsuginibacillus halophilus]|uniref:Uncharacterized protein n=1 Tax=Salsuginibacillus halophilus TaxID=517424 RepID=A0A2P8HXF2_9BACI|nr:hypothetical protein [Salsuginibacillus halophilus]PSL50902.1 hypothetical protein B0H94_102179 [Salsuginibacillus halophilus]
MKRPSIWAGLTVTAALLSACGPEAEVGIKDENTYAIYDEDAELLGLHAVFENAAEMPSDHVYAAYRINDSEIAEAANSDYFRFNLNPGQEDEERIMLDGREQFAVSDGLELSDYFPENSEDIEGAFTVLLLSKEGEIIDELTIDRVSEIDS